MNDEVEKLPLSEGHNTALNRKAFRKAARRRRWCWGLSDTRLIRGSSSEVVVCTMKHADGDTMTHMLRLTAAWFRCGVKKKKKKTWTTQQSEFHDAVPSPAQFSCESARACFYLLVWFERKRIVITHIRPWQIEGGQRKGRERERGVSGVVAREWKRDMQKGRAVSLRNEPDKRKGLGRWAEETGSTLLN